MTREKCVEDYANCFRSYFPLLGTMEKVVEISLLTGRTEGEKSEPPAETISRVMTTADEK